MTASQILGVECNLIGDNMVQKDITREMLSTIRSINEGIEDTKRGGAIAITDDPKFGQQVLTNQEQAFKSNVDGGAEFAAENVEQPENSPLIYFPDNGNLVFSGKIRNIKWQFSLKDESGNGCYIWTDGLQLTNENIQLLGKLHGMYENWRDEWNSQGKLLDMLGK